MLIGLFLVWNWIGCGGHVEGASVFYIGSGKKYFRHRCGWSLPPSTSNVETTFCENELYWGGGVERVSCAW